MTYMECTPGEQNLFLNSILEQTTISEIAQSHGISERTIRDWRREKFHANYETARSLSVKYGVPLPEHVQLEDGWHLEAAAAAGGKARTRLHGPPGDLDSRRRGGVMSQAKRKADPEYYKDLGCKVRKQTSALVPSEQLAELLGILLGDGGLTNYQVKVTLHKVIDLEYAYFVSNLMAEIFLEEPAWYDTQNVFNITLSGASYVDELEKLGLKRGNKVKNQVAIPQWILEDDTYRRACLRGLFDTDGGIYLHQKPSGVYVGWCFSSHSRPIIFAVSDILSSLDFSHSVQQGTQVRMYKLSDILRYMAVIGSNNPKNMNKIHEAGRA